MPRPGRVGLAVAEKLRPTNRDIDVKTGGNYDLSALGGRLSKGDRIGWRIIDDTGKRYSSVRKFFEAFAARDAIEQTTSLFQDRGRSACTGETSVDWRLSVNRAEQQCSSISITGKRFGSVIIIGNFVLVVPLDFQLLLYTKQCFALPGDHGTRQTLRENPVRLRINGFR